MAILVYDGPVSGPIDGPWVEIPAASLYVVQHVGYGSNGLRVQFSLDGVDAVALATSPSAASNPTLRQASAQGSPATAWQIAGLPMSYARFHIDSGIPDATAKIYIQSL